MDSLNKVINNVYDLERDLKIENNFNMIQFFRDVENLEREYFQYLENKKNDVKLKIV